MQVLLVITFIGKLNLFGAMAFFSLYIVYGASVAYIEMQRHQRKAGATRAAPATLGTAVQLQPLLSGGLLQPSAALLPAAADAADTREPKICFCCCELQWGAVSLQFSAQSVTDLPPDERSMSVIQAAPSQVC